MYLIALLGVQVQTRTETTAQPVNICPIHLWPVSDHRTTVDQILCYLEQCFYLEAQPCTVQLFPFSITPDSAHEGWLMS